MNTVQLAASGVMDPFARDHKSELERIEMAAWLDFYAAAPGPFAKEAGLDATRIGNFSVFACKKFPDTFFNRSLGLGDAEPVTEAMLDRAVAWLRDHCGSEWAVTIGPDPAPADFPIWLAARNLHLAHAGTTRFGRAATPIVPLVDCEFEVLLVPADRAADFGRTARDGFDMPEHFDQWLGALAGRPAWSAYVAYDRDIPIGVGAMFVHKDLAWLGLGATLPVYRGRGVQSAMLARRIRDAAALGVKRLSIGTFYAGDGQAANGSHRNVLRAGFSFSHVSREYVAYGSF